MALQGDGKIVVVGRASNADAFNFALARYNPNGTLDPSFSGDGRQTTDFGGYLDGAAAVVLQGTKIVAVGAGDDDDGAGRRFRAPTPQQRFSWRRPASCASTSGPCCSCRRASGSW